MKKIVIIANFCDYGDENSNNRFNYIFNLVKQKMDAILLTSSFSHREKRHRVVENNVDNIILLDELGYKKNVSIARFVSHFLFGLNVYKYLVSMDKKPDIIYCAIPSLSSAFMAMIYSKKYKIKFLIDIQDLWPEAFKIVFDPIFISNIIYAPFSYLANKLYKGCDVAFSVSETYLNRVKKVNKYVQGFYVYLGTDLMQVDKISMCEEKKNENEIWVAYIGTLGSNYDINCIIDSIDLLPVDLQKDVKFKIIGDGPMLYKFKKYADKKNISVDFLGSLKYEKMISILKKCDIAVNPIKKGAAGSIINKVGDYAAIGLPVINTQECIEYRNLLSKFHGGINCECENAYSVSQALKELIENKEKRNQMGRNNRKIAELYFDRNKTYKLIEDVLFEKRS